MQNMAEKEQGNLVMVDHARIDRTISPKDLIVWSKLRVAIHAAVGADDTFMPEA